MEQKRPGWWHRLSNRSEHPRINFVVDFFQDLLTVALPVTGLRLYIAFEHWLDTALPGAASYLPVDHVRVLTTILYAVSLLCITVSAGCTLWKVMIESVKGLRR